jgi:hypothetical protein
MKIIISENQYKRLIESRYLKSTPKLRESINKYLDDYISSGSRKIGIKSRNYGNLREDWCVNGVNSITMIYYFDDGNFDSGSLLISKDVVEKVQERFSVRESFTLNTIEEWYEDTMIPKFESIIGESGFYIKNIDKVRSKPCIPEPIKPEGITDEEMIDFIDKNTAYRRQEIIDKIESGQRDLEDFYLDIVDTINRKNIYGI